MLTCFLLQSDAMQAGARANGPLLDTCGPLDASEALKLEYIYWVDSGHQLSPEMREQNRGSSHIQE